MSALAVVGLAVVTSAPAHAQDAAWRVECTGDGKTLDCRAVQQLIHRETRQSLLLIMARRATDPKAAALTLVLPLGLNLTAPVQLRVDGNKPEDHPIQTCTNTGCFVALTASPNLVQAMRTGKQLRVTIAKNTMGRHGTVLEFERLAEAGLVRADSGVPIDVAAEASTERKKKLLERARESRDVLKQVKASEKAAEPPPPEPEAQPSLDLGGSDGDR